MTIEFDGENNKLGTTTSNSVTIKTNDTDAITVDNSQNVGIGTTSPSAQLHIQGSDITDQIIIENTNSGAETAPDLTLYRNSSSPADSDTLGNIIFRGRNDNSEDINYFEITAVAKDVSDGTEDTQVEFATKAGGSNSTIMTFVSDKIGIGTSSPSAKLHLDQSSNTETEIRASAATVYTKIKANDIGGFSAIDFSHSLRFVDGSGNTKATVTSSSVNTFANLNVNGTLAKDSGSFRISHPLASKNATHYLVHSFVESPQANNIYRGKVDLVNGTATVNLDTVSSMTEGTFVALNRDIHVYTTNETDWDAVKGSVSGNTLTINCQDNTSTATVSWLVIGERQDQHMMDTDWTDDNGRVIVERLKETE